MESREIIKIIKSYEHDKYFGADMCNLPYTEYNDVANDIVKLSNRHNKQLLNEIDKLKSKVSNWMDKYTEVNEENKKLQSELKDCTENYNHYVDKCFKLESELKDKDIDLQHYKKMASNNNHF